MEHIWPVIQGFLFFHMKLNIWTFGNIWVINSFFSVFHHKQINWATFTEGGVICKACCQDPLGWRVVRALEKFTVHFHITFKGRACKKARPGGGRLPKGHIILGRPEESSWRGSLEMGPQLQRVVVEQQACQDQRNYQEKAWKWEDTQESIGKRILVILSKKEKKTK